MATKRLYVGNVNYDATDADLRSFFSGYEVTETKIVTDRDTGRPRGFAFVELADGNKVAQAIAELHEKQMMGRTVTVNEARDREPRRGGGGGDRDRSGRRERRGGY